MKFSYTSIPPELAELCAECARRCGGRGEANERTDTKYLETAS